MSTAVICVVQAIALRINFNKYDSVLDYVAIAGVGAVLLLWLIMLLAVPGEKTDLVILEQVCLPENFVRDRSQGYKTFFMLNSTEHEIFSCSDMLKCQQLLAFQHVWVGNIAI